MMALGVFQILLVLVAIVVGYTIFLAPIISARYSSSSGPSLLGTLLLAGLGGSLLLILIGASWMVSYTTITPNQAMETPPTTVNLRGDAVTEPSLPTASDSVEAIAPETVVVEVYGVVTPSQGSAVAVETQSRELALPEWAQAPGPPTSNGRRTTMVLSSKRFATTGEASADLLRQAMQELQPQMREQYPALVERGFPENPTAELLKQVGIVKRECVATYPLEVGEFKEPYLQMFWDLEFSPETAQRLYAAWRPRLILDRLLILGLAVAVISVMLGMASFIFRRLSAR